MIEVKAPHPVPTGLRRVFLAGSIEMGSAENWQKTFADSMKDLNCILMNPRRDDWNSNWEQTIKNPQFKKQVNWELNSLEDADYVIFYFDPNTKSPITLMELGFISSICPLDVIVCCPDGFWRKGNVEIMCDRQNYKLVGTLEELITTFRNEFIDREVDAFV